MTPQRKLLDALNVVKDSLPATLDVRFRPSEIYDTDRNTYLGDRKRLLKVIREVAILLANIQDDKYQAECTQILRLHNFSNYTTHNVEFGVFLEAIKALLSFLEKLTVPTKSKLFCY